ncbi:hypothetical protein [Clostridium beijerinckii]|uniref:Uncharacterized protein n=1 Tax=Clostridium beijerinckii TaxID=1520 RepID=A0A9Q5CUT0_CLOBE|nr:hypothetical protein [Clostridium beijerinckii]AQS06183.1 hypothetical protein CLBIJ_36300 [Clostridium beijerinckii]MBA2886219.1 hypothetical protein [Clostridium beijerinckii]MBA2900923.1 hypothetical protein [Clostridium beijerinckii]MBA2910778.1 hypothetical protein [Clostridium beijerinckii]MBA9014211.1 hypothetical protein [Clostridium beijerinckii]
MYNCVLCSIHACNKRELDKGAKNCPSFDEKIGEINEVYKEKDNLYITVI